MSNRINTLTELARQALDQYKVDMAAGCEPVYPQWARDLQDVLGERRQLTTALEDCVAVMERELNGLAVIQPELRQARTALAIAGAA